MIPSGKHTKNYGASPFLLWKLRISMAMFYVANCYSHYQRVHQGMDVVAGIHSRPKEWMLWMRHILIGDWNMTGWHDFPETVGNDPLDFSASWHTTSFIRRLGGFLKWGYPQIIHFNGMTFIFPYIGNNNPNWLTFFRGVGIPPTSISVDFSHFGTL